MTTKCSSATEMPGIILRSWVESKELPECSVDGGGQSQHWVEVKNLSPIPYKVEVSCECEDHSVQYENQGDRVACWTTLFTLPAMRSDGPAKVTQRASIISAVMGEERDRVIEINCAYGNGQQMWAWKPDHLQVDVAP